MRRIIIHEVKSNRYGYLHRLVIETQDGTVGHLPTRVVGSWFADSEVAVLVDNDKVFGAAPCGPTDLPTVFRATAAEHTTQEL